MNVIGYAVYQLALEAPITAAADEIHKCFFFHCFFGGMGLDVSSESRGRGFTRRIRLHFLRRIRGGI